MVEVPAVALTADVFAATWSFFSIGTNDLSQYTLAIDRSHPTLAPQLDALHPAVLHLIDLTVRAARRHSRRVAVCGALAGEEEAVPVLLGLGVEELSVSVSVVASIKERVRTLRAAQCRALSAAALSAATRRRRPRTGATVMKNAFAILQKMGRSLMLPVSVLPAAGILLGVGSARFSWMPAGLSNLMAQAGGAVFSSLPMLFAIAVALGLTNNDGVSALAAVVGLFVMLATMGGGGAVLRRAGDEHLRRELDRYRRLRRHADRRHRRVAVHALLQDPAALLPGLLRREAVRADRDGVCRDRLRPGAGAGLAARGPHHQGVLVLGGVLEPGVRRSSSTAWSSACCCRSGCTYLERPVLLRDRQLHQDHR
jgi:hypothetical protein